ncbi:hypothetical protein BRC86_07455 [Halobacteriales archaeon QS_3_64_16]|nr:MAG: hypothetical protein BRC86_07455 [Halobacteriales archaeon QS_3_64_16]
MDARRLAPTLGIGFCSLALVVLAIPYLLVGNSTAVSFYYANGAINPLVAGLLCAITIVVFAAGREDRTDPGIAAGVGLAVGTFVALIAIAWALTVPEELVLQLSRNDLLAYHRSALVLASVGVFASGLWYARALSLL